MSNMPVQVTEQKPDNARESAVGVFRSVDKRTPSGKITSVKAELPLLERNKELAWIDVLR